MFAKMEPTMTVVHLVAVVIILIAIVLIALAEWQIVRIKRLRDEMGLPRSVAISTGEGWRYRLSRNGHKPGVVYDWEREGDV